MLDLGANTSLTHVRKMFVRTTVNAFQQNRKDTNAYANQVLYCSNKTFSKQFFNTASTTMIF